MTPDQCRAARAIVAISQDDLAAQSGVAKATIAAFELGQRQPYPRTIAAIRAADAAIVVVDGINGVEVGTRRVWKLLDEMQKPRLIFVSKLDKENSDFFIGFSEE